MSMSEANSGGRITTIILWILRVLLGAAFLFAGISKLAGQPMMVAEFEQVGLGQWFRYVTGLLEIVGAIALVVPRYSVLGAILLLAIDAGAFVAQVTVLHVDWVHCVVIGAVIAIVIYLQRKAIPFIN